MPRPITKNQMADFWMSEFNREAVIYLDGRNRLVGGFCILCGNHGRIDTRGKVFSPAGHESGGVAFCICPNGRALKKAGAKIDVA